MGRGDRGGRWARPAAESTRRRGLHRCRVGSLGAPGSGSGPPAPRPPGRRSANGDPDPRCQPCPCASLGVRVGVRDEGAPRRRSRQPPRPSFFVAFRNLGLFGDKRVKTGRQRPRAAADGPKVGDFSIHGSGDCVLASVFLKGSPGRVWEPRGVPGGCVAGQGGPGRQLAPE